MATIDVKHVYKLFAAGRACARARPAALGQAQGRGAGRNGLQRRANDVSLGIESGEIFVIMGLSGSGKSTLVRHFNRLIEPTAGEIVIDGNDVIKLDAHGLRELRRFKVSMVFQNFGLLPHQTVLDNAAYALRTRGEKRHDAAEAARNWLTKVGARRLWRSLSGRAVGRDAAACRLRARAGGRYRRVADGRGVFRT